MALICADCHNSLPLTEFYASARGTPFRFCKTCAMDRQRGRRDVERAALKVHEGLEPVAQRFCALQWSRSRVAS